MPITINGTTGVTSPGGDTQAADTTINGVRVGRGAGAGSTNTVVGSSALNSNTTGAEAAILGFQAGINNTTGNGNVYIGAYSGFTGTTATRNTAVGQAAGYSLTTGSGNTFVGSAGSSNLVGAGWRMTTGNNNTILGGFAGVGGPLDIRTSNNFIVLSDGDGNPRQWIDSSNVTHNYGNTNTFSFNKRITGVRTAASSGSAVKLVQIGPTAALSIRIMAIPADNNQGGGCATWSGNITVAFGGGGGTAGVSSSALGGGSISGISVAYDNGGSPIYTINCTLTYSGSAPTIYYVIEGLSTQAFVPL